MRLRLFVAATAVALVTPALSGLAPVSALPVAPGSFMSPNVEWLGAIPDAAGISAKFITNRKGIAEWMYMSTTKGLTIYDVSNPALPLLTGVLPLPHFENEDIDGNANIAIISTSPGGQIFIIDTFVKSRPILKHVLQADDGDAHVSACVDDCERYLYSTEGSALKVVDLLAKPEPKITYVDWVKSIGPVHEVDQDDQGIVWMTGSNGGGGFAVHPLKTGSAKIKAKTSKASPKNPVLITDMVVNGHNVGNDPEVNDFIQHNSKRPTKATYKQTKGKPRIARGGVLAVTEEDYVPNCEGQGQFHTFQASGSVETGTPLRLLDTWKMREGTMSPQSGDRAEGTVFCSAHWFTVRDNIVAIGWYGGGTRLLDISNPRDIRQVGYFVSADQETWAAYWVPGPSGVVYSVDVERGLDILQVDLKRTGATVMAPAPVRTKVSFLQPRKGSPYAYACPTLAPLSR